jgi:hypothetical protein
MTILFDVKGLKFKSNESKQPLRYTIYLDLYGRHIIWNQRSISYHMSVMTCMMCLYIFVGTPLVPSYLAYPERPAAPAVGLSICHLVMSEYT